MKPYLLIAGQNCYPGAGIEDWKGCFETRKDVESQIITVPVYRTITKGKNKGEKEFVYNYYKINGDEGNYDWYQIVDLRDWENPRF